MPPRLSSQTLRASRAGLSVLTSSSTSVAVASAPPPERAPFPHISSSLPPSRNFSAAASLRKRNSPVNKRLMQDWFRDEGNRLKRHRPGHQTYLKPLTAPGDRPLDGRPFPSNPEFISQPVLSEAARELVWNKVMVKWEGIKAVSAELGIDQRRVAAVVRMKEIEKDWESKGQKLAKPYSKAVLEMVPTHDYPEDRPVVALEPINEIHVHSYTQQQLFVPTSESKRFTREDAARAFHTDMLPPEGRVPHPELVEMERRVRDGMRVSESWERFKQEARQAEEAVDKKVLSAEARDKKMTTAFTTGRFEFRIKTMTTENVGKDGRKRDAVGWKYGVPLDDRRRARVKIPTQIG